MTINYYSKEVYGQTLFYLASQADANTWHRMTGRKTITSSDMAYMEVLTGVTFERVFDKEN